ncbi:alpha/beta fold hydrolase [Streptomyces sp. NPDC086549]|uniref:alpha/beta fold hydrolase n=1 Tax=Streptomyces sp. NPDC086549 TaxID=3365752 RepID=UPI003827E227
MAKRPLHSPRRGRAGGVRGSAHEQGGGARRGACQADEDADGGQRPASSLQGAEAVFVVGDVLAVTQRPVSVQALTAELSGEPAWRTVPSWALIATQDNAIPAQAQEFMAERAGSHVVRVEASHAVSISQPGAVADLIIEAAKSTR